MCANPAERLVLGTAQLGMDYGIANCSGKPDRKTAEQIIQKAFDSGVRDFDTAQGYGDAEKVLGEVLRYLGISDKVRIISKLNPGLNHLNERVLAEAIETSLTWLGIPSLYALMLHRQDLLEIWDRGLVRIMDQFVRRGQVTRIGVSVYSPQWALRALKTDGVSLVQIPSNVLDRRFEQAKVFELASERNKEIHVRSVFLQGLLLIAPEMLSSHMAFAHSFIEKLKHIAHDFNMSEKEICLGYVKACYPCAKIVIGVENPIQLEENVALWKRLSLSSHVIQTIRDTFGQLDEKVLDPSQWPKTTK